MTATDAKETQECDSENQALRIPLHFAGPNSKFPHFDYPMRVYVGPDGQVVNDAIKEDMVNRFGRVMGLRHEEPLSDSEIQDDLSQPIDGADAAQAYVKAIGIMENREYDGRLKKVEVEPKRRF